ncbi:MAG: hypothetical protein ACK2U1_11180, partial [Anaerolineales bacterium]
SWVTWGDGKILSGLLVDRSTFQVLERYYNLNLTPLLTVDAGWPPEAADEYPTMEAYRLAHIQNIDPVIECARSLFRLFQDHRIDLSKLEQARQEWGYVKSNTRE